MVTALVAVNSTGGQNQSSTSEVNAFYEMAVFRALAVS